MCDRSGNCGQFHLVLHRTVGLFAVRRFLALVDGIKPTRIFANSDANSIACSVWLRFLVAQFFQQNYLYQIFFPQNLGDFVLDCVCRGNVLFNLPLRVAVHFGNVGRRIK